MHIRFPTIPMSGTFPNKIFFALLQTRVWYTKNRNFMIQPFDLNAQFDDVVKRKWIDV